MKPVSKLLFVMMCGIAVAGCKSRPVPHSAYQTTLPPVGTVATTGIGEKMLINSDAVETRALVLAQDQPLGEFIVRKGTYPLIADKAEYQTFGGVVMATAAGTAAKQNKLHLFSKDGSICIGRAPCAKFDYVMGVTTNYQAASFQTTLIYSGRIGDKITLGYREFQRNVARPAFNNDVTYDLSESMILGYKGARLEVLHASNTEISYKVLAGFD
ncbi:hypothetical protein [Janthinobacterium sp. JC611]|uniref:hypothetical protein n=1 Tax=Janthinobacterium sp. JC611 TaxID=2816201 RepID=UPI001BFD7D8A|nr:hypothetical protein [Janthinobacterium sp. JC611]